MGFVSNIKDTNAGNIVGVKDRSPYEEITFADRVGFLDEVTTPGNYFITCSSSLEPSHSMEMYGFPNSVRSFPIPLLVEENPDGTHTQHVKYKVGLPMPSVANYDPHYTNWNYYRISKFVSGNETWYDWVSDASVAGELNLGSESDSGDIVLEDGSTWDGTNPSLRNAFNNIINTIYPVGSIYMSLTDSTVNMVQARFGGTWEKIESRFLLAASSSYTVNSTGGSADAVVVSHTHPLNGTNAKTSDQAAHTHPLNGTNAKAVDVGGHTHTEYAGINESSSGLFTSITGTRSYPNTHIIGGAGKTSSNGGHGHSLTGNTSTGGAHSHTLSGNTGAASDGVSGTGKNMPPYLAVYMYKRTA